MVIAACFPVGTSESVASRAETALFLGLMCFAWSLLRVVSKPTSVIVNKGLLVMEDSSQVAFLVCNTLLPSVLYPNGSWNR